MESIALWPIAPLLIVLSFFAAMISAIAGFGGGMVFLPFLVAAFGPERAVPIMTVMMLLGTTSRAWVNRSALKWRIIRWFALGTIFGAALGAWVFLEMNPYWLLKAIGLFIILAVIVRRLPGKRLRIRDAKAFAPIGAAGGFIGGVVGGMGPMVSPFFLAAGLTGAAFVGTVGACAICMHIVKIFVYNKGGAVDASTLIIGSALGLSMVAGTLVGKKVLDRLDAKKFTLIVEVLLVVIGIWFLVRPV